MKHILLLITLGVLLVGCDNDGTLEFPVLPNPTPADALTFAGSEACRTCHQAQYESWEKSRHTKKVQVASMETIVNDADSDGTNDFVQGGAGATFDVMSSVPANQTTFDDYTLSPGVEFPKLGWQNGEPVVRVGPVTYPVKYVLGGTGKWKQRYMVTIDNQEYISPVQYNDISREYVPYHPEHWYVVNGKTLEGYLYNSAAQTPVTESKVRNSWQRRCIACHTMGARDLTKNADGEYGASIADMLATPQGEGPNFASLPIGCEACHGPGARHIELGGGIGTILNPVNLATDRGNEVCGGCHNRGGSVNAEGFGFPWAEGSLIDGGFRPGDVLDDFFVPTSREGSRFWDNGAQSASSHRQQHLEHGTSAHAAAGVTCWDCHDPHGSGIEGDLKAPTTQLCLSCHDGRGDIDSNNLSLHTRHQDPESHDCANCHLVKTAKSAVKYDIPSHTYQVIFPVESETTPNLPNSCEKCHPDDTTQELTGMLAARWPDVHPVAYARSQMNPFGAGYNLLGGLALDPLGGPLTYQWSLKSGPPSFTQDDLIGATAMDALFIPSAPGLYTFSLVVTNEDGLRSWIGETTVDVPVGVVQQTPDLTQSFYVGSNTCAACHRDTHDDWEITRHPQKTRRPFAGAGVAFADTNNNGVNDWMEGPFNIATDADPDNTAWDTLTYDGTSAPILDFDDARNVYTVTIGPVTYDVTWILGGTGKWKQRYMATIGGGEYILPNQYNEVTNEWVVYHSEHWYTIDGGDLDGYLYNDTDQTPVTEGTTRNSWQRRCTYCHSTGATDLTVNGDGEYGSDIQTMIDNNTLAETGVGCEACHGPGSQHVSTPSLRGAIVNPNKLTSRRSNEICGACHNRGSSINAEGFGFPWGPALDGGFFQPGIHDLDDFYVPVAETGSRFWADPFGHAKSHHQQWLEFRFSSHYTKAGMTCATCHTGHNEDINGQLKQEEVAQCTSCHKGFEDTNGNKFLNHSRHSPGITKCSDCHLPLTSKSAINFDVRAHSFMVIWPEATDDSGIPNSCTECHGDDTEEIQDDVNWLWGDLLPYAEPRIIDPRDDEAKRKIVGVTAPVTLMLDGTRSYDPNGEPIATYAWSILSAPDASDAKLSSRLVAKPTIDIVEPGTYVFSLVARDLKGASKPRTVTITIE